MPFSVLIVDDEALARERIRTLLEGEPDFDVVGEAAKGLDAVEAIRDLRPDLVFLDVQMPQLDGFEVVERIGVREMPLTIFVTAYDQHALRAFEAQAIDYLMKPFDRDRFRRTLDRVRRYRSTKVDPDLGGKLDRLLRALDDRSEYADQFVVRTGMKHVIVRVKEIDVITSGKNYLNLHTQKKTYLLRETMTRMEEQLDPTEFVRIHRSSIVRISLIRELESVFEGEYVVTLANGMKLNSSRTYRQRLQHVAGISAARRTAESDES